MFNFNYSLPQFFNNDLIYSYNYVNQINMINYIFNNEILKAQYLRQNCYNIIPDQQVNYNYFLPQNFQIPYVYLNYYINNPIQKPKIDESKFSNIPPINCVSPTNNNIINKNNILCSDSNQNIEGKIFLYNLYF